MRRARVARRPHVLLIGENRGSFRRPSVFRSKKSHVFQ